jgi:hypothetical protein
MDLQEQYKTPIGELEVLIHRGGGYENGKFIEPVEIKAKDEAKNLIVSDASKIMAGRMLPKGGYSAGIQALVLGDGGGSEVVTKTIAQIAEKSRKLLGDTVNTAVEFLDSSNNVVGTLNLTTGAISGTWTSRVRYSWTFLESEANHNINELMMVGGNATVAAGSGIAFNFKSRPTFGKTSEDRMTIRWIIQY